MFEYFIFIVINSTVYKELNTLKLIDKVRANNTKQALIKAEENLPSDVYVGAWHNSKMIAWNCARGCEIVDKVDDLPYQTKHSIKDVMTDITDDLKAIAHGRHPKSFE
jgi:hypothetical protein